MSTPTHLPEARRPFTLDRIVRLIITLAIIVALVWLVHRLKNVLLPFCIATLVAYIFEPFVQFNRRLLHLRGRVIAIFVTLFEALFITGILCWIFVPMIVAEVEQMAGMLSAYAGQQIQIPYIPESVHDFVRRNIDIERISAMISNINWATTIEEALKTVWGVLTGSISLIIGLAGWFIVLLYVVFIMIDYERLGLLFRRLVPPASRKTVFKIGHDLKVSMNRYFRGQALVAFIVGVLFSIGFAIIGLPLAVVMGMFIGLLNMVPYLQLVSLIPTTLLCVVYSVGNGTPFWPFFLAMIAVYCIVQLIQDLYLTPRIMGKAMGLNPAIILLSLSIWGSLLGVLGMIIALPLTTLLLAYYNEYVIDRHPADEEIAEEIERQ